MNSKQQQLANSFSKMNDMQKDAIFNVNGPLLILAGAGSGKTTVLVNRIANMINYGNAYFDDNISDLSQCKPINPWNILAITFTNKAATELKERLEKMLGAEVALKVNAGTFHSICAKILRREISVLGYNSNFTIYDTDDSVKVIKSCLEELNLDDKVNSPKALLSIISKAKDSLTSPKDYLIENENNVQGKISGNVYTIYQRKLKESNALDFDDIIVLTVKLLKENPDVLEHYQNLYKYVLVDEYQDTNHAQYMLVSLLSGKYKNLCVVGDDDQSIYKFRGATIENILSFEKEFKDAKVIRLEQNYRSTQNILDAANSVIKNNTARKGKNLWTDNGEGDKIVFYKSPDEEKESAFIIKKISEDVVKGEQFSDHSILYRMNAQSANIEHQLVRAGIPYKIVGSKKFYERKEIKDIVSYLQ
ncbi:MAG: UvrD-helicase domain-containing protein, partial [Oscillospiraceae bacterium]